MTRKILLLLFAFQTVLGARGFAQLQPGQKVPNFSLTDPDGKTVSFYQVRGEITLVTFFATWCAPCAVELPVIEEKIWQAFKDRGVKVIAIDLMEFPQLVQQYVKSRGLTFPAYIDSDGSVFAQFGQILPHNALIGPDSTVALSAPGLELDKILNLLSQFLTTSSVPALPRESNLHLEVYPNPQPADIPVTETRIQLSLPGNGAGQLQIFNLLGQVLVSRKIPFAPQNQRELRLSDLVNPEALFPGIYFLRLEFRGRVLTRKWTLLK